MFPKVSPLMKKILTKMCMCDPKQRPSAAQLLEMDDYIKLVGHEESEVQQIAQEQDTDLRASRLLKQFAYTKKKNKVLEQVLAENPMDDQIAKPKFEKEYDSETSSKARHEIHGDILKDDIQKMQKKYDMNQLISEHDKAESEANLRGEFKRINSHMDFAMLNVLLANEAKDFLQRYRGLFPELHKDQISQLIFSLAKFAYSKIQGLKKAFYERENLFGEDKELWGKYVTSNRYQIKVKEINIQANLCQTVFRSLFKKH